MDARLVHEDSLVAIMIGFNNSSDPLSDACDLQINMPVVNVVIIHKCN